MLVEQLVRKYYGILTERSALIMRKMSAHHPIPHLPHSSILSRYLVLLQISPKHFNYHLIYNIFVYLLVDYISALLLLEQ